MKKLEAFFHDEVSASRAFLVQKILLPVLALDAWMLMIGHAGRYGAGGFNVAHFRWLDSLQPVPTPDFYVGILLLAGFLSLTLTFVTTQTLPALVLFALYTFSWSMSMLDSYQHHYFISLVLLCLAFFPKLEARDVHPVPDGKRRHRPKRTTGFGYPLLATTIAILYWYTAVAKMDAKWLQGYTIRAISNADTAFAPLVKLAEGFGMSSDTFWAVLATSVIPLEIVIAAGYLVAVHRDRTDAKWVHWFTNAMLVSALLLHFGNESMELKIGWFSYYMITFATIMLSPLWFVDRLAMLVTVPVRGLGEIADQIANKLKGAALPTSFVAAAVLVGVGTVLDLPGAQRAAIVGAVVLSLLAVALWFKERPAAALRISMASLSGALVMWLAIVSSPVRFDFYRFTGGHKLREADLEGSLDAYRKAKKYAPQGEDDRSSKIEQLERRIEIRDRAKAGKQ